MASPRSSRKRPRRQLPLLHLELPVELDEELEYIVDRLADLVLLPIRIATSPAARRVYLSGLLLLVVSGALLFLSTIAYVLFYTSYVPHAAVSVPVYLQYQYGSALALLRGLGEATGGADQVIREAAAIAVLQDQREQQYPTGTALLVPTLSSQQKYDVEVVLEVPHSPTNLGLGNFMIDLALLAPMGSTSAASTADDGASAAVVERRKRMAAQYSGGTFGSEDADSFIEEEAVVVRARRPALLRYTSRHITLLRQAIALPWYALGWSQEREQLRVSILENVEFTAPRTRALRGGVPGIPDRVRVTLEGKVPPEVYTVRVELRARLRGLRWLMYQYRIASFLFFTGTFFMATMGTTVVVYGTLTFREIMREDDGDEASRMIKQEDGGDYRDSIAIGGPTDDGLSDTSRQFPTGHGKAPLKFTGRGRPRERGSSGEVAVDDDGEGRPVKEEEEDGGHREPTQYGGEAGTSRSLQATVHEADDEDDDLGIAAGDDYEDAGAESFRDSGIGTGRDERDVAAARRRKRSIQAGQT